MNFLGPVFCGDLSDLEFGDETLIVQQACCHILTHLRIVPLLLGSAFNGLFCDRRRSRSW